MLGETLQLLLNGLVAGTILALPAIGFTAIYAVLRFPNFAVASPARIAFDFPNTANALARPIRPGHLAHCPHLLELLKALPRIPA